MPQRSEESLLSQDRPFAAAQACPEQREGVTNSYTCGCAGRLCNSPAAPLTAVAFSLDMPTEPVSRILPSAIRPGLVSPRRSPSGDRSAAERDSCLSRPFVFFVVQYVPGDLDFATALQRLSGQTHLGFVGARHPALSLAQPRSAPGGTRFKPETGFLGCLALSPAVKCVYPTASWCFTKSPFCSIIS